MQRLGAMFSEIAVEVAGEIAIEVVEEVAGNMAGVMEVVISAAFAGAILENRTMSFGVGSMHQGAVFGDAEQNFA